ncbi:adhesin [Sinorhizobium meliloti]|nr:adhesin [Sinorhizobium meliloti]RVO50872.1 adhesin [Sinorhizobium meliloti]
MALGRQSVSAGSGSLAFGNGSYANSNGSVAIGQSAYAANVRAIAIGGDDAFAWREAEQTKAGGSQSIAMGVRARTKSLVVDDPDTVANEADPGGASDAIAIGTDAQANGDRSLAIGRQNQAGNEQSIGIGAGNTATGKLSIGIGSSNVASGEQSLSLGAGNNALGQGSISIGTETTAGGLRSIAFGVRASTKEANLDIPDDVAAIDAIAIGTNTKANGDRSVSIGTGSQAGSGAVSIGDAAKAVGDKSVSIGTESWADGDESVSIGLVNNAGFEGNDRIKGGQTSVSLGAFNQSPGIEAIAIGARNEANADRSIAIGSRAKTKAADPAQADGGARDAVAIGTDALANDDRSISIGWNSSTSLNDSISIGTRATSGSAGDIMIGTGSGTGSTSGQNNVALGVAASQKVKGSSNIAIGDSAGGSREGDNNVAIGTNAGIQFSESEHETAVRADLVVSDAVSIGNEALASADEAIAIGTGAVASGLKSISIGVGNTVSGASSGAIGDPTDITGTGSYSLGNDNTIAADNAGTFGNDNTLADAADGSRVIGNGNNIDVSDAFVLGNGADVTEVGGVALGSGSVSDTGADVAGYVPGGASTADQNAIEATQSTRGAVAVGNPDAETGVYRQITGVAAGTADSDAANVAQLKSVETIAKTGWKLTTDSGSIDGIGPGDELVLKGGDGNIVISNQILSNDVSIDLADEIEVNRVTARDPDTGASTVLDENGLSFTTQDANGEDTALGPRVTAAGIQAAGKITNVAAGEADTDAVNFSQLRQVETASGNTDQRAVKYDWTDANTNGVIDEGELNLDSVTLAGGMGGTRISNLAPGALSAASTDAVNGSQLFGLRSRVSNVAVALGGGAAYDPVKDEWIAPKYTIGGTDYSNVGDALAAVGGTAGAGWSLSAQGANASNVAPGETVDLRSGDGNIVVSKAETGDTVSFDLADDLDVSESITVGADPADPNAPTTVITGGSIVIGSTMLGSNGLVITGGPSVTTDGIDAGGMKVTNVANGTVAKDSKDAVNGGQLFDVVANATANGVGYDDKSKGTLTLEGANGTKITNVAAGDLNANSTDAVNGSQLYATNVKVDRLDTEVKEIDSRVTYIESFQGDLENAAVYDTDAAGKRLNTLTLEGGDPDKPVLIANVAKGVKATDAVNVGQLDESVAESKSYTDEKTEWAIDQAAIYTDQVIETKVSAVNNYAQQRFAQLSGEIGQVRSEARQAAAIGLAAASLRFDNEPGKLSVALGGGFWRSEGALAFGAGYTSEDGRVRANLTGAAAGGNVGVGAGLSITLN